MKKITLLLLATTIIFSTFAQSKKYNDAMLKNIAQIDSAFLKPETFISLSNNFERIGNKEKSQWLPFYYAALCRVNYAYMQKDVNGNDAIATYATTLINKADSLQQNNSEISCIKSMIASVQMLVNPQQRYMTYGTTVQKELQNAMKQDSTNPRPYLLKGQGLKYTPAQFGGGCKTALPILKTALEKFTTFKPAMDIAPNWGDEYNNKMIKECEGK